LLVKAVQVSAATISSVMKPAAPMAPGATIWAMPNRGAKIRPSAST